MASTTVAVGSTVGLHARPATIVAEAAAGFDDEITLGRAGAETDPIDASSALLIMTLGADEGDQIVVTSENEEAVAAIAALIEKDLDA